MKKTVIILFAALALVALPAVAQEKYSPKPGTFSFGLTFNPMAGGVNYQPGVGDFAKDYITSLGGDAHSMFFLAKEPLASLMLKYRMAPATSLRFNVGFNGSNTHYKEYVDDQVALKANPTGGAKTFDQINAKLNSFTLGVALEFSKSVKAFQFNAGVGLLYAIGGGSMSFDYGNELLEDFGWARPTIPMLAGNADPSKSLNQFPNVATVAGKNVGIDNGYAKERYNIGYNHGIGVSFDMGVEWFVFDHVSLAAAMTVTPFMYVFQPQTWTVYEGYSKFTGTIQTYNDLVSPGSNAILYGLESLGFRLSLNYYL